MAAKYGTKTCRLEFNSKGFKALLMSAEMRECIYGLAAEIALDAGEGFNARTFYGDRAGRVMATVDADTLEARLAQAETKCLKIAAEKQRTIQ